MPTSTGKARWDPTTIALMLRNTAYVGRAVFGRSRHVQAPPRLRPLRGRPHPARKPNSRVPVPREEWIEIPVPALIDPAVFEAAQPQLDENRRRRRELRRRPGWLLQGLVVCRRCGYAFYGKMARGRVGGRRPAAGRLRHLPLHRDGRAPLRRAGGLRQPLGTRIASPELFPKLELLPH